MLLVVQDCNLRPEEPCMIGTNNAEDIVTVHRDRTAYRLSGV